MGRSGLRGSGSVGAACTRGLALQLDLGAPLIRWAGPQLAFGKTEDRKEKGLSQVPTTYKWLGQDRDPGFSGLQDWGPLTGFRKGW